MRSLSGRVTGAFGRGLKIRLSALCPSGRPLCGFTWWLCFMPGPFAGLRRCHSRWGRTTGQLRELCLRLKHEQNAWLAPWLSELLVEARREAFSALPSDALVVPVPLHWWRLLAARIQPGRDAGRRRGETTQAPDPPIIETSRGDTRRLADLSRTARSEVMRNAFRARGHSKITGRTVLLVDDVLTTGATCGAAARALKQAGAARVVVAVVARTEQTTV